MKVGSKDDKKASSVKVSKSTEEKKSWWKFWGGSKQDEKVVQDKVAKEAVKPVAKTKVDIKRPLERKLTEKDHLETRHNELLNSVDSICRALEETKDRTIEFKSTDILPPIPMENIEALTRSTEQVSGALDQVSTHLASVGKRDDLMIKSLDRVDGTLGSLQQTNEKSITAIDGLKGVLSGVRAAMGEMQQETKKSAKRYEELVEKMSKTEAEHSATVLKIQKRTLWVNVALGVALVIGLIVFAGS
ncbi:MAG: hypothetical protein ACSHYF_07125 [Verrucomicrobiaceae bacterium]